MRILLAEDERELSNALSAILKHNHYTVDAVYNGTDALNYGLSENYDGIVLDIMMPQMNGIDVLKLLRSNGVETPILLLTAKAELDDKILGLNSGADDYMTKPFAIGEFIARIRALTRRNTAFAPNKLTMGNITLNRENFQLSTDKASVHLANREFQVLEMLMLNPNVLISTSKFMDRIWSFDSEAERNVVCVYIAYLRRKLASIGANVEIKATRGVGYTLALIDEE